MNELKGIVVSLVFVVLTGCNEVSNLALHEPGVYMGASDPLLSANAEERANELQARFNLAEVDR